MNRGAPIFLVIAALGGFFSGAAIDGELSPHLPNVQNVSIINNFFNNQAFSFIQSAELSGQGQAIIEHAFIDFTIDQIQVGENFKNIVSECVFSSEESFGGDIFPDDSIDDGICIICKLEGECKDVNETFVDLPHGTRLGAINSLLATDGIFLTVDARPGGHDTAIIFDGDVPGDLDENPSPDPDLRASGICNGTPPNSCAGLHMLIIPENIDDDVTNLDPYDPFDADHPGDPPPDGLIDIPDDSAAGGTMKFQFGQSREIVSFDLVDMDRASAAVHEARVYSDFSCTQLVATEVFDPGSVATTDGSVQTIDMNNVVGRCLEIEVHDSFGVTNLVAECATWTAGGHILGVGRVNLHDGYTANEEIHIPIDGMLDVRTPKHVAVEILSANLNYQGLGHGDVLNDQFLGAYGIKISGKVWSGGNLIDRDPVVFDTELAGTSDPDLEVDFGNISIVQENTNGCDAGGGAISGTCDDPDDNAQGGIQQFQFDPVRYVNSLVWIDADRPEPFGTIHLFGDYDCDNYPNFDPNAPGSTWIDSINIPDMGDGSIQVLIPVNIEQVGCMVADYTDSGGLSRLNLGCPLPDDPITMPWFQGDPHDPPSEKETIYWVGFENYYSVSNNWMVDPAYNPSDDVLKTVSTDKVDPYEETHVLAGTGKTYGSEARWNSDYTFDVSDFHDVMISVWYSYKSTEDVDALSFYYKNDNGDWVEIFDVPNPWIGNGYQSTWEMGMVTIPDDDLPDMLDFQIRWKSSSHYEWLMIDALHIEGIPEH